MNPIDQHLQDISEIRSMMERSSKFLSLSGLSGVTAGVAALLGAGFAYWRLHQDPAGSVPDPALVRFLVLDATVVLLAAVGLSMFFSVRMARRKELPLWSPTTKLMLVNLTIPLCAGGLLSLILWYHGFLSLIAPSTLLFYGLALLNAGTFTLGEVRYLAVCEMLLGLLAFWWLDLQLLFWALGFGVLHIVYGIAAYVQYEQ